MSFELEGFDGMMAELERLGNVDELAPKMLEAAEPIMTRNLKAAASTHKRTGEMESSIKPTKPKQTKDGWSLTVRSTGTDRKGVRNMEKMAYLEYGTSKQAATPVLGPAVRQSETACLAAMQNAFDEATK